MRRAYTVAVPLCANVPAAVRRQLFRLKHMGVRETRDNARLRVRLFSALILLNRELSMAGQVATVMREQPGLGDHVAYFFKNNVERLAFVIPYMVRGLRNRERCVYVAHQNTTGDILAHLKKAGVDTDAAVASGALSVLTKDETYLRHGVFEPKKMIADLDRDVRSALRDGFAGLRITAEMSWALDLPSALSRVCEYEENLRRQWPAQLGGLCQYDESLFPPDVVERMAGCHWVVVRHGSIIRQHVPGAEHEASPRQEA